MYSLEELSRFGTPLSKVNGIYSNYPREEKAILMIYKDARNLTIKNIVDSLVYKALMYKTKEKSHLSKVQYYIVQKREDSCVCLVEFKYKISTQSVADLSVNGMEGKYFAVENVSAIKDSLKEEDYMDGVPVPLDPTTIGNHDQRVSTNEKAPSLPPLGLYNDDFCSIEIQYAIEKHGTEKALKNALQCMKDDCKKMLDVVSEISSRSQSMMVKFDVLEKKIKLLEEKG
jgi:hypothetical protein